MRKSIAVALLLVVPLVLLVLLGLVGASEALTLYDGFNVKPIDPAKWYGSESNPGPGAPNTESSRKLSGGQLAIGLTSYGFTSSDTGASPPQNLRLSPTDPAPITTWQADVTVKSVKVVGCAANTTPTRSGAAILGFFFNDGSSTGPGDRTGDIGAGIESRRDSIAGDHIVSYVFRCSDANCNTSATSAFHMFTHVWTKGAADTLSVQWDKPNKQFIFNVNPGGPGAETKTLSYTSSDANPPGVARKDLRSVNSTASCQSGPRTSATMKALFDNVMVNP